jgi:hypothetical protein
LVCRVMGGFLSLFSLPFMGRVSSAARRVGKCGPERRAGA